MKFLRPIQVGDEVSCFSTVDHVGEHSIAVKIETWARTRGAGASAEKVTEGIYTYVALNLPRMDDGLDGGFFVVYTRQGPLTAAGYTAALKHALGRAMRSVAPSPRIPAASVARSGRATPPGSTARAAGAAI